ncbi:MAG: malto-oligosyltrehalose trehalohydrolase [Usitatibacter sp.]
MKRRHEMPFGAQFGEEATRFRLWAPACELVRIEFGNPARAAAMEAVGDGWHEARIAGVRPGDAYAFHVKAGGPAVADPASRFNPWDANAPSVVVDPQAYDWQDDAWRGRPWHEAVVYEMHIGAFTSEGTYAAATARLDHLADTGITAIELLPLADFVGTRNWGYDGVLPFAPDSAYGTPEDLKRFIDAAHQRGLMVLLDVVYNHFGPEGNYLSMYAPQFFNAAHQTPWGAAINFDGDHSRTVRDFFIHNALYWIQEYRFDGLRMDAIHAIADDSPTHIVTEIAEAVAAGPGLERHVHIVLENDANSATLLARDSRQATAQWNDDAHHAFHLLLTGERDGYYRDYADRPAWHLARTLSEGFSYQGEPSAHRNGDQRGEHSSHLPLEAFVPFLQNHDQVGNRAMGERLVTLAPPKALRLASATLLLAPSVPLLFMGEEFGANTPFLYFCDFKGDLARAVREGRRREFAAFARFAGDGATDTIPDPNDPRTFLDSKLDWEQLGARENAAWLEHYRALLHLRARAIVPRLLHGASGSFSITSETGIAIDWKLGDGSRLHLRANYGNRPVLMKAGVGKLLHFEGGEPHADSLAAWSGAWTLESA